MLKFLKYVIKSVVIGIVSLLIINFLGQFINYYIPINVISVFLVGFFHLPGLIVLLIVLLL